MQTSAGRTLCLHWHLPSLLKVCLAADASLSGATPAEAREGLSSSSQKTFEKKHVSNMGPEAQSEVRMDSPYCRSLHATCAISKSCWTALLQPASLQRYHHRWQATTRKLSPLPSTI